MHSDKITVSHRSLWTSKVEKQKGNTVISRTFRWKQTAVVALQQIYLTL